MRLVALMIALSSVLLAATPAAAQAPTQGTKPFARPSLQAEALRLEPVLRRENTLQGRTGPQLAREADQARTRGDLRAAVAAFAALAVAEPANVDAWLRLSDLYRQIDTGQNWQERNDFRQRSTSAAYIGYQRARSRPDEARALHFLAEALMARFEHRDALAALRIALETNETQPVRERYEELLAQYGFRILAYQVDADASSPRVCFQFSDPIRPGLDATPFVAMPSGIPGNVSARDGELCVDGLRHGQHYEVKLRAGLPASTGETLARDADYRIYVRDRTPSVRFTGRNYVLPRIGQQGIPVVSVNLDQVRLFVYRIGDRSLAPTVLDDNFMAALSRNDARRLAREDSTPVWNGLLDVAKRDNEETTTAFPVAEALGDRLEAGVYVMIARRPDAPPPAMTDEEEARDDDWEPRSTQWFVVSDLGVAALTAGDGLHVELRSLATTRPVADAELRLVAVNNEILGTARTDAQGRARFEPGLTRGEGGLAPGVLVAVKDGDYGFLNLSQSAFDLTDRGVTGRAAPGPVDAYLFTERGVYRSSETVHVTALLRDPSGAAIRGLPLTLVLERPDGVEMRRTVVEDRGGGGYTWSAPLLANASTGTWRLKALVDPRRPPVGQTTFLVEDYVPDRLELTLERQSPAISREQPAAIAVSGRWLFGAPAADLALEGETIVSATDAPPAGLEGYRVGLADEQLTPLRRPLDGLPRTNAQGAARVSVPLPDLPASSRPLQVETTLRLVELAGRGVERSLAFPVLERRAWIGVKPLFGDSIGEGETATFDVAMLGANGQPAAQRGLRWELSRLESRLQWFRVDGRWNFELVSGARRVADGRVDVAPGQPGRIAAQVGWGRYRLDVSAEGANAPHTSVVFSAGWSGGEARAESPDILEVALDKASYAAGETARLRVVARFAGEATVRVVGEAVHETRSAALAQGQNTIDLPVGRDWGAGAYVVVSAFRPLDAQARRQPGRAVGVRWLAVDRSPRLLTVALDAPADMQPRRALRVPVRIGGAQGEEARVVVAAVDVGILNLTNHQPPNPADHFFGQRALGAELRDLYGFLIDGMQGARGRIRSGGDAPAELMASPPAQAPLALYSGVVQVGPDGAATVEFDIPPFAGTVRLMAVAWTPSRVGSASRDVIVRDPVVVTGTLPRFLAAGDRSRFLVELHNVDGPPGDYTVSVDVSGPVVMPADALRRTVRLDRGQRASVTIPVTAAGFGRAAFDLAVAGPQGVTSGQSYALGIHPATPVTTRRSVRTLAANGGTLEVGPDLLADVVPGTGAVSVSVQPSSVFDVPGLIKSLDRYPFACTEQTVSRALPLLYVSSLVADERDLGLDAPSGETIARAVERVFARQSSNGSFGLWGVGGDDLWLDAYVTDFLTRAKERGHLPAERREYQRGLDLALDRLRNQVANFSATDRDDAGSGAHAYALYVLARNGRPVIGDLRYLADARASDIASSLAQGQVAAGLALLGDRGRAQSLFVRATEGLGAAEPDEAGRADYGTNLRDGAGLLTLMSETNAEAQLRQRVLGLIERLRAQRRTMSTQENMWLALAAQGAREAGERILLEVAGQRRSGPLSRSFRASDLAAAPVVIRNVSTQALQAVVSVIGSPVAPEPAGGAEFQVERTYQRLDGARVDPRQVRQNERLVVILKITEPEPTFGRIVLEDRLPAGFEIDVPALVPSARLTGARAAPGGGDPEDPSANDGARPAYTEFRDDRFVAAWNRTEDSPQEITVAYIVRAVAPGSYAHPGPYVEDMYRPERFARGASGSVEVTAAP
jgi:hypothetical protein